MSPENPQPEPETSLLAEIRRRRVFRVIGAYVLVAWVLMQAGEIVFPAFELPNSALRLLILSLFAGLPFVVIAAWFLDVTPTGIRLAQRISQRTSGGARDASSGENDTALGRSAEMILLGICIPIFAFAVILLSVAIRGVDAPSLLEQGAPASTTPSLAVLPFDDLSMDGDDSSFFSRGMHEDILTQLARVHPLKLISRTSVMAYEGSDKSAEQIGRELGVDHLLEGRIRRTSERVRVTAQLVKAATDEHLWAEQFDADLKDVFEVQARIARSIARALQTELVGDDSKGTTPGVAVLPAAYDAYLKARDIHRNLDAEDRRSLERARHLYETAIQLDDRFAAAWLKLGILHTEAAWFGFDPSPGRIEKAQAALDRARALGAEPDQLALAEGIFAYYAESDFGKAALHFGLAAKLAPGNAEAHFYQAMILRRLGQIPAALESHRRALELDPLNLAARDEYALTLALAGELTESRDVLKSILSSDPDRLRARLQKWQLDLELDGQPEALLEEILSAPRDRWREQHYSMLETVAILAGRPEAALEVVSQRRAPRPDSGYLDYQRAVLLGFTGEAQAKAADLAEARRKFSRLLSQRPGAVPELARRRVEALFALQSGEIDEAIRLQSLNVEAQPIESDVIVGSAPLWLLIHIQLAGGRVSDAITSLERLQSAVALGSVLYGGHYVLERSPEFEAARADPRLQAFIERTRPDYAKSWPAPTQATAVAQ